MMINGNVDDDDQHREKQKDLKLHKKVKARISKSKLQFNQKCWKVFISQTLLFPVLSLFHQNVRVSDNWIEFFFHPLFFYSPTFSDCVNCGVTKKHREKLNRLLWLTRAHLLRLCDEGWTSFSSSFSSSPLEGSERSDGSPLEVRMTLPESSERPGRSPQESSER